MIEHRWASFLQKIKINKAKYTHFLCRSINLLSLSFVKDITSHHTCKVEHVSQSSARGTDVISINTLRDVLMCQARLVAAARVFVVVTGRLRRSAIISP